MSDPNTGHSAETTPTPAATPAPAADVSAPTPDATPSATPTSVPSPAPAAPEPAPVINTTTDTSSSSIDAPGGWHNDIAPEYRSIADKYNTPTDLAKAYGELNSRFSKPFEIPGPDASESDRALYRKRLGVPETPDGYGLTTPETLSNLVGEQGAEAMNAQITELAQKAHDLGAPPAVAQGLLDHYAEIRTKEAADLRQLQDQNHQRSMDILKAEWGQSYGENIAVAQRALNTFGGEQAEMIKNKMVEGKPLGDDPDFIRFLANFGRNMSETTPEMIMDSSKMESMEERFNELNQKYVDENDPIAKQKIGDELNAIGKKLFPG